MELKRGINPKRLFVIIYIVFFLLYLFIGFQSAESIGTTPISEISIPGIDLRSDVVKLDLGKNGLETPDIVAGCFSKSKNKTLIIGHSTTVFKDLYKIQIDDSIYYNNKKYSVAKIEFLEKSKIKMSEILQEENADTIILMTCAGDLLENGDASERLIVTAL